MPPPTRTNYLGPAPKNDPNNPAGGAERIKLLQSYGFEWVSGEGLSALWRAPGGSPVREKEALDLIDREQQRQFGPQPRVDDTRQTQVDAAGFVHQFDPRTGTWPVAKDEAGNPLTVRQPAGPQAPRPETIVRKNGDVYALDPHTGKPTLVGNIGKEAAAKQTFTDPRTGEMMVYDPDTETSRGTGVVIDFPQESPAAKRAADLAATREERAARQGESAAERRARLEEGVAERGARASEGAANRGFQGQESALDRAARAAEFASNRSVEQARLANDTERLGFERNAQKLAGARQFSELANSSDPLAVTSFLAAGGGNISNAIASGANAVSDRGMLGAARTLQAVEGFSRPSAPVDTTNYGPGGGASPGASGPGGDFWSSVPALAGAKGSIAGVASNLPGDRANMPPGWTAQQGPGGSTNYAPPAPTADYAPAPYTAPAPPAWSGADQGPGFGPHLAAGGFTRAPSFVVGDSPTGMPTGRQETVTNPTGAPISVTPDNVVLPDEAATGTAGAGPPPDATQPIADLLRSLADLIASRGPLPTPRFALGTGLGALPGEETITEADRPYIERVRQLRQNVQYPRLNPFAVDFSRQAPSQRALFYQGRQAQYGVSPEDQAAEAARYQIAGFRRGGQGY